MAELARKIDDLVALVVAANGSEIELLMKLAKPVLYQ